VDDGFHLKVNGNEVASHNWAPIVDKSFGWLEGMHLDDDSDSNVIESSEIRLTGGSKYFVQLQYFHSSHNRYQKLTNPYLELKWKSNLFDVSSIPTAYMYPVNVPRALKVSGYFKDKFRISLLRDQIPAFFDT